MSVFVFFCPNLILTISSVWWLRAVAQFNFSNRFVVAGSESFFAVHHSCSSYTILAVITPGRVSYYSNLFVEGDDECPCFSVIGSNDDDTDFLPLTIMFDCMSESLLILVILLDHSHFALFSPSWLFQCISRKSLSFVIVSSKSSDPISCGEKSLHVSKTRGDDDKKMQH